MSKHILVYSQYFFPEQFRINDICLELVNRGFKVSVVTGIPNYPEGKFYEGYNWNNRRRENWNGIEIYRMPIFERRKNKLNLVINYSSFVFASKLLEKNLPKDIDAIFTYEVSPMTQALPAVWYANKLNVPHYLYVMDLWPENVIAVTNTRNQMVVKSIDMMVDYIYKNSEVILASSNSFVKAIVNRGVSSGKVMFWPQYAEDTYGVKEKNNDYVQIPNFKERTFVFAGNIGEGQGLGTLPKAAYALKHMQISIKFVIIGNGRYMDTLLGLIKELDVADFFYFIPRQPAEMIPYYLAKFDVAMITLNNKKIFEMTIPAKVQSLMACAKPLLVVANGEVQDIVRESESGLAGDAGDVEKLVSNIIKYTKMDDSQLKELGNNAKEYHDLHFNKKVLMDKFESIIKGE